MIPRAQLLDYFVELTDTLIDGFDVVDFLHDLTVKAAVASGADAVGLVLADHQGRVRYMASSNEEGKLLELLQIQNDEGPCLDAILRGVPVVNADLGRASGRWPTFAPAASAAGFQSVHAFPMRLRTQTIGALNIFGADDSRFDPDDVRVVQALADVATIAILQQRDRSESELITEQLQAALQSRVTIEQAKGALARSQSISPSAAFNVLLTTARSTRQGLAEVARSVIADLEAPSG